MPEITFKIKTPDIPNFLTIETSVGMRQDGFKDSMKVSIADLTTKQLEDIADEWKSELIKKANKQRAAR